MFFRERQRSVFSECESDGNPKEIVSTNGTTYTATFIVLENAKYFIFSFYKA